MIPVRLVSCLPQFSRPPNRSLLRSCRSYWVGRRRADKKPWWCAECVRMRVRVGVDENRPLTRCSSESLSDGRASTVATAAALLHDVYHVDDVLSHVTSDWTEPFISVGLQGYFNFA
ncbi:hypothetical protein J6590_002209 [Homalodisca vitripennis]|nr:hypothetical protein J6590_002209 [Homalodisca vitripennis]